MPKFLYDEWNKNFEQDFNKVKTLMKKKFAEKKWIDSFYSSSANWNLLEKCFNNAVIF